MQFNQQKDITMETENTEEEVVDPIDARRDEVAYYDDNIATCHALLAALPSEWPEHLAALRPMPDRHKTAASLDDLADVELFAQLTLRDDTAARLRAETYERAKAAAVLAHLEATQAE